MCTGVEIALIGAGTAAAASSIDAANTQKKNMKRSLEDAQRAKDERDAAAAKATQDAYAAQQFQKRALRENSLFTGGGTSDGLQTMGV